MSQGKKITWSDYFEIAPALLSLNPDLEPHSLSDDDIALLVQMLPSFDDAYLPEDKEKIKRLRWLLLDQSCDDEHEGTFSILNQETHPQTNTQKDAPW